MSHCTINEINSTILFGSNPKKANINFWVPLKLWESLSFLKDNRKDLLLYIKHIYFSDIQRNGFPFHPVILLEIKAKLQNMQSKSKWSSGTINSVLTVQYNSADRHTYLYLHTPWEITMQEFNSGFLVARVSKSFETCQADTTEPTAPISNPHLYSHLSFDSK